MEIHAFAGMKIETSQKLYNILEKKEKIKKKIKLKKSWK
jgi:hypothetical protein